MLGILGAWSGQYLTILSGIMLVLLGLPMAFWPLRWASVLRWRLPDHTHLAIYFGRCLGSVVIAIALMSVCAARMAAVQKFWFGFLALTGVFMIVVHAYGAIKRIQPLPETIEIAVWVGLVLLTLCFWPAS